jgi:hypothetical protein
MSETSSPSRPTAGRPPNDGEAAMSWIQLRVTTKRKSAYVRAANKRKLSDWIFEHLDKAAEYAPNEKGKNDNG